MSHTTSRMNFDTGTLVNPFEGLQTAITGIGNTFDKYMAREEEGAARRERQKLLEAQDARAAESHTMQMDEYNVKKGERDALKRITSDPSIIQTALDAGLYNTPQNQKMTNEVSAIGSALNEDIQTVNRLAAPELQKAMAAQDALYLTPEQEAEKTRLGAAYAGPHLFSRFDATDTAEAQLGLDSDRGKLDYVSRMAGTDKYGKPLAALKPEIEDTALAADRFGKALADSGSSANMERVRSAIVPTLSKSELSDHIIRAYTAQGASYEDAVKAAERQTKDMQSPEEREKQRLESAKTYMDLGGDYSTALSKLYKDEGKSIFNIGANGATSTVEGGEGVSLKSIEELVAKFKDTVGASDKNIISPDVIQQIDTTARQALDGRLTANLGDGTTVTPDFTGLGNQERLGIAYQALSTKGIPDITLTGGGTLNKDATVVEMTRLTNLARGLDIYGKPITTATAVKERENLLDTISPRKVTKTGGTSSAATGRLASVIPEEEKNKALDYINTASSILASRPDNKHSALEVYSGLGDVVKSLNNDYIEGVRDTHKGNIEEHDEYFKTGTGISGASNKGNDYVPAEITEGNAHIAKTASNRPVADKYMGNHKVAIEEANPNITYGNGAYYKSLSTGKTLRLPTPDKPLSDMTIEEVYAYQTKLNDATRDAGVGILKGKVVGTSAVGMFQFIKGTLRDGLEGLKKKYPDKYGDLDITKTKFTKDLQLDLARELYNEVHKNTNLAATWTSVPCKTVGCYANTSFEEALPMLLTGEGALSPAGGKSGNLASTTNQEGAVNSLDPKLSVEQQREDATATAARAFAALDNDGQATTVAQSKQTIADLVKQAKGVGISEAWVNNTAEQGDIEALQQAVNAGTSSRILANLYGVGNSMLGAGKLIGAGLGGSYDIIFNNANSAQALRSNKGLLDSATEDFRTAGKQFSTISPIGERLAAASYSSGTGAVPKGNINSNDIISEQSRFEGPIRHSIIDPTNPTDVYGLDTDGRLGKLKDAQAIDNLGEETLGLLGGLGILVKAKPLVASALARLRGVSTNGLVKNPYTSSVLNVPGAVTKDALPPHLQRILVKNRLLGVQ